MPKRPDTNPCQMTQVHVRPEKIVFETQSQDEVRGFLHEMFSAMGLLSGLEWKMQDDGSAVFVVKNDQQAIALCLIWENAGVFIAELA